MSCWNGVYFVAASMYKRKGTRMIVRVIATRAQLVYRDLPQYIAGDALCVHNPQLSRMLNDWRLVTSAT